jgi:hypothetical protein
LYVGAAGAAPGTNYSKFHTYLRGAVTGSVYTGAAPIRMLTFAEYNFGAEAALRFTSPGSAQTFSSGCRNGKCRCSSSRYTAYLATNGINRN